jgi:hypothetical protein
MLPVFAEPPEVGVIRYVDGARGSCADAGEAGIGRGGDVLQG